MSEFFSTVVCVSAVDPFGKKFDRVSRFVAKSIDNDITVELDYNSDILSIKAGDEVSLFLTFNDAVPQFGDYSCGMNGKLFKIEEFEKSNSFYISFGGLLFKLECSPSLLTGIKTGTNCKLFIKTKLV